VDSKPDGEGRTLNLRRWDDIFEYGMGYAKPGNDMSFPSARRNKGGTMEKRYSKKVMYVHEHDVSALLMLWTQALASLLREVFLYVGPSGVRWGRNTRQVRRRHILHVNRVVRYI
jgi:hypothetical protein